MFLDRSTRTVLAVILTTAAVILGVNLAINPGGLTDSMGPLFIVLLGVAAILFAWNWREAYAGAHEADIEDADADDLHALPIVVAPALQPELAAPAVTLTDAAEAAAAPVNVMPPMPEPVIAPMPDPVTPPAIDPPAPAPVPVAPPVPAPEPVTPPIPEPVTPPMPEPVEPPVPAPAEPEVPAPVEAPMPEAVNDAPAPAAEKIIPPVAVDPPQPGPTPGLTDLADPAQKASAPEADAPQTVEDAKNGEPVAEKVIGDAMAAPEQPDASQASAADIDDFTRIEGIGKYYRDALHKIGYDTFAQLAAEQHETILQKLLAGGFRRHPTIPTWPEQAGFAARGDWDGLKALQATLIGGRKA